MSRCIFSNKGMAVDLIFSTGSCHILLVRRTVLHCTTNLCNEKIALLAAVTTSLVLFRIRSLLSFSLISVFGRTTYNCIVLSCVLFKSHQRGRISHARQSGEFSNFSHYLDPSRNDEHNQKPHRVSWYCCRRSWNRKNQTRAVCRNRT